MRLIYLHGLDSDENAIKAQIVSRHADTLNDGLIANRGDVSHETLPHISVIRPNLNIRPDAVVALLSKLIHEDPANTVLMGSSLGGYFAQLMHDITGVPAILLNPSIRPDISFRRFLNEHFSDAMADDTLSSDTVIYTTTGGWQILYEDLAWLEAHRLQVMDSDKVRVFLCLADELLDADATHQFYADKGVQVLAIEGGDHRISDFEDYVGQMMDWALALWQKEQAR